MTSVLEAPHRPMEQQWGCMDPHLQSKAEICKLLTKLEVEPAVVTGPGDILPPVFVAALDLDILLRQCTDPPIWQVEPPIPLRQLTERSMSMHRTLGCWEFPRYQDKKNRARYPLVTAKALGAVGEGAHRFFYRRLVAQIPEGDFVDHRCHNKHCCYPRHLEVVSHAENNRRGHEDKRHRIQPQIWQPESTIS